MKRAVDGVWARVRSWHPEPTIVRAEQRFDERQNGKRLLDLIKMSVDTHPVASKSLARAGAS